MQSSGASVEHLCESVSWLKKNIQTDVIQFPKDVQYDKGDICDAVSNFLLGASWISASQKINLGNVNELQDFFHALITTATVEAKKMHRFDQLSIKQDAKQEKEAWEKPKKSLSFNRISKIAALDNGTMVESFKYLNYCQLATNSLVSKRYCDLIQTHRHMLALLNVDSIRMIRRSNIFHVEPPVIKIFNNELSAIEYNKWVVCNGYSKQTSPEISTAVNPPDYELSAYGDYKDPNQSITPVFYALIKELNRDSWPLFQHFVRLLSDPFVSIRDVKLTPQSDVFNLLSATIDRSTCGRLQCEELKFIYEGYFQGQKFLNWIKDHVRCVKFRIAVSACRDKQLLDFSSTGSHCTSEIVAIGSHISTAVLIDFVQVFMDLKNCDESRMVELIRGNVSKQSKEVLKTIYEQFLILYLNTTSEDHLSIVRVYEFINADIGKKLKLTLTSVLNSANLPVHKIKVKIITL